MRSPTPSLAGIGPIQTDLATRRRGQVAASTKAIAIATKALEVSYGVGR